MCKMSVQLQDEGKYEMEEVTIDMHSAANTTLTTSQKSPMPSRTQLT